MMDVLRFFLVLAFGMVLAADPPPPQCADVQMWVDIGSAAVNKSGIFLKSEMKFLSGQDLNEEWFINEDLINSTKMHYTNHPEAFSLAEVNELDKVDNEIAHINRFVVNAEPNGHVFWYPFKKKRVTLTCHIGVSEPELYWPRISTAQYQWAHLDSPKTIAKKPPAYAVPSHPILQWNPVDYYIIALTTFGGRLHYVYLVPNSLWLSIYDAATSRIVRITRPGRYTKVLVSDRFDQFSWVRIQKTQSAGMDLDIVKAMKELSSMYHVVDPVIYKCRFGDETALLMEDQIKLCPNGNFDVLTIYQPRMLEYYV